MHMKLLTRCVRYDGGTPQEAAADQNDRDEDHLRDGPINWYRDVDNYMNTLVSKQVNEIRSVYVLLIYTIWIIEE